VVQNVDPRTTSLAVVDYETLDSPSFFSNAAEASIGYIMQAFLPIVHHSNAFNSLKFERIITNYFLQGATPKRVEKERHTQGTSPILIRT